MCSESSDLDHLGPDCEWIGANVDFCRRKATSVEKNCYRPKTQDVKTDVAIYCLVVA